MKKATFSTTSRQAAEDFLKAHEDLIGNKDDGYDNNAATVDWEHLRFIGLSVIDGTSFIPPTGGAKGGLFAPTYGHFTDAEITDDNE